MIWSILVVADGMAAVAGMMAAVRPFKLAIILPAQQLDFVILQDLANAQIAVGPEAVDLLFGQRLAFYRGLVPICGLQCQFSRCFLCPAAKTGISAPPVMRY